jgi:apolipoprotein N-acyltransferase
MKAVGTVLAIVAVYMIPKLHGDQVLASAHNVSSADSVTVGIVQPNLDPWEKWRRDPMRIINLYLSLTDSLLAVSPVKPEIVLWPETAIPVRLLSAGASGYRDHLRDGMKNKGFSLVTGFPHMVIYGDSSLAPASAKRIPSTGERYDDFNAVAFLESDNPNIRWYGKMKMVPLAERVPYADAFYYLDFLRWGVGIGGWQIGPDTTVFSDRATGAEFSAMICYESTYPDFVSSFVRKGAEFISVITIDSWWGRMSGAFQHQQFAILRAIENRRWIARCALGGFSCFIDPYGRVYKKTGLFERSVIAMRIPRRTDLTFYSLNPGVLPVSCALISGLFVLGAGARRVIEHQRKNRNDRSEK